MDILGKSYMLIMSESLGVKQRDVIHYYLNFKFLEISIPYRFVPTAAY